MTRRRARLAATAATAVAVALLAALALGSCGGPRGEFAGVSSTIGTRGQARPVDAAEAAKGFRTPRHFRPTPAPVRVKIPAIDVNTPLQRLGRAGNGTVEVPKGPNQWDEAGWYEGGTRPGDPGSAVILGHVDSKAAGPAVFYRLRELRPGNPVKVVRADGSEVTFTVDRVERYPKQRFPTAEVYYPTLKPMLRLVTCGGAFDDEAHSYVDNVIVFASLGG